MKKLRSAAAVLCTLSVLALALFMPRLAAMVTDYRLAGSMVQMENSAVSLTLASQTDGEELTGQADIFQALTLFRGDCSMVSLSSAGRNMTRDQVRAVAMELMEAFARVAGPELIPYSEEPDVIPILFTSQESPGLFAVFWRCVWTLPDGSEDIFWIEDQTGLVMGFQIFTAAAYPETAFLMAEQYMLQGLEASAYTQIDLTGDALGVDGSLDETASAEMALFDETTLAFLSDYDITIVLSRNVDGLDETCEIPFFILDGWHYFNFATDGSTVSYSNAAISD